MEDDASRSGDEYFGTYRLLNLIGQGGMGEVWRAFDTRRERTVALKRLASSWAENAEFRERFRREARITARLASAHVVPIHDFGEIDGRLFIDMRLVGGGDLGAILSASPNGLGVERAVDLTAQIAGGLDAAHREGLIHRDVKPSNVLLEPDDARDLAYLMDFGIVKVAMETGDDGLTVTGTTLGTPAFMAPELFTDTGSASVASDVYALGCVLFEMLTGRRPFPGKGVASLTTQHLYAPVPMISSVRPDLAAFDPVLGRALAKRPGERPPSVRMLAGEAREAATRALRGPTDGPRVDSWSPTMDSGSPPAYAGGPGAGPRSWPRTDAPSGTPRGPGPSYSAGPSYPPGPGPSYPPGPGSSYSSGPSYPPAPGSGPGPGQGPPPEEKVPAWRRLLGKRRTLVAVIAVVVVLVAGGIVVGVTVGGGSTQAPPAIVAAPPGPPTLVPVALDTPNGVAVSADGRRLYVVNAGGNVTTIDAASGAVDTVTPVGASPAEIVLSPDGHRAYITNSGSDQAPSNTVSVIDIDNGATIATVTVGTRPLGLVLTPDGTRLFVANYGTNGSTDDTVSEIDTISNTVTATFHVGLGPTRPSVSPDGSQVYVPVQGGPPGQPGATLVVIDVATGRLTPLTPGTVEANAAITQADGRKVYLISNGGTNGVGGVVNYDLFARSGPSSGPGVTNAPREGALSPDGRTLVIPNYGTDAAPGHSVSLIDTATLTLRRSVDLAGRPYAATVSPDGHDAWVTTTNQNGLWRVPLG